MVCLSWIRFASPLSNVRITQLTCYSTDSTVLVVLHRPDTGRTAIFSPIIAGSLISGEMFPQSCSLATAAVLLPVYTAVTWQQVSVSKYNISIFRSLFNLRNGGDNFHRNFGFLPIIQHHNRDNSIFLLHSISRYDCKYKWHTGSHWTDGIFLPQCCLHKVWRTLKDVLNKVY
jgi:hypothetical protein